MIEDHYPSETERAILYPAALGFPEEEAGSCDDENAARKFLAQNPTWGGKLYTRTSTPWVEVLP